MSSLEQIRAGLEQAWDGVFKGWEQLFNKATQALTYFTPQKPSGGLETVQEQVLQNASRWGLVAAEMFEDENQIVVKLEIPGMEAGDFDVSVSASNILIIRGIKQMQRENKNAHYHMVECAYGQFERAIELPTSVDDAQASAKYEQGILRITLPKASSSQKRKVDVNIA